MAKTINFEGKLYSFPDDATDAEIAEALDQAAPVPHGAALAEQQAGADLTDRRTAQAAAAAKAAEPPPLKNPDDLAQSVRVANTAYAPYLAASGTGATIGSFAGPVGAATGAAAGPLALGIGDTLAAGYNWLGGDVFGAPKITAPSDLMRQGMVTAAPQVFSMPETPGQRVLYSGVNAGAGAVSGGPGLNTVASMMKPGLVPEVLRAAAGTPAVNAAAGFGAGAAGQGAAEMGAEPWAQGVASFIGGLATGGPAALLHGRTPGGRPPAVDQVALTDATKNAKNAQYAAMESAGVKYNKSDVRDLFGRMEAALPALGHDLVPPPITEALRAARAQLATGPRNEIGPKALNDLGRTLEIYAQGNPTVGRIVGEFKGMIDDFMGDPATSLNASRATVSEARALAAAAQKTADGVAATKAGLGPAPNSTQDLDMGWSTTAKTAAGSPTLTVITNPSKAQMAKLAATAGKDPVSLRYVTDLDGNIHVWRGDAPSAMHTQVADKLNIPIEGGVGVDPTMSMGGTGVVRVGKNGSVTYEGSVRDPKADKAAISVLSKAKKVETAWAKNDPAVKKADADLRKLQKAAADGDPAALAKLPKAQKAYDDAVESLAPADPKAATAAREAAETQNAAREQANTLARRGFRADDIDRVLNQVNNSVEGGRDASQQVRQRLTALSQSPAFHRFSPDEQAAVRAAIRGGPIANTLAFLGGFAPGNGVRGAINTAVGGGSLMAGTPAVAALTFGVAPLARAGANAMANARLDRLATFLKTGEVPPAPPRGSLGAGVVAGTAADSRNNRKRNAFAN